MKSMVNNVPDTAYEHEFWVARYIDGEYWFYGAYDTVRKAEEVAYMVDGEIV